MISWSQNAATIHLIVLVLVGDACCFRSKKSSWSIPKKCLTTKVSGNIIISLKVNKKYMVSKSQYEICSPQGTLEKSDVTDKNVANVVGT